MLAPELYGTSCLALATLRSADGNSKRSFKVGNIDLTKKGLRQDTKIPEINRFLCTKSET